MNFYQTILQKINAGHKIFALLIDPDKCCHELLNHIMNLKNCPDLILVGGSQTTRSCEETVLKLKRLTNTPIVLFPGNFQQFTSMADAILLLSLISGRNPEFLIGEQVKAAIAIKESSMESIPTGYILVDGGKRSAVSMMSQTEPMSIQNVGLIASTALAGQQLGQKLIYLEAGSGAQTPVNANIIKQVKQLIDVPLIVGGGIRTTDAMHTAYNAGANIVVIGNHFETHPEEIDVFCKEAKSM